MTLILAPYQIWADRLTKNPKYATDHAPTEEHGTTQEQMAWRDRLQL